MAEAKTQDATFEKEEIIKAADQFNTSVELMAGALYNVTGPITKTEAQKRLEEFLKRPIKNTDK